MTVLGLVGQVVRDGYDGHHWGDGWMWLWGTLMMVIVVGLVAASIWALVRRDRDEQRPRGSGRHGRRAREILDERYARGEIESDEYREKVQHLEEQR